VDGFTHMNAEGRARMVDVTQKQPTERLAVARASVWMDEATLTAIKGGVLAKGDVLAVAQVAGVMAAKQTGQWIPMCHPLPVTGVDMSFRLDEATSRVEIEARVKVFGPTGVEMEALTAATAAALTIYDMAKAVDKGMVLGPAYLVRKEGGKSGLYQQFHAHVTQVAGGDPEFGVLLLRKDSTVLLLPPGADRPAGTNPVAWLDHPDVAQGQKLACGPLLVVPQSCDHQRRWMAIVRQPGVLRPGDRLSEVAKQ
jgi:cyclic pyranopterin phosphate synthase